MSYIEKEKLIKADIDSIENRVRHAFNQGYDLGFKDGKKRTKPQEQEPTIKIDYRRAFKIACELLNGDVLYGIDADKIYELMMKKDGVISSSSYEEYILNHLQELDQGQYASEPTTKNDLPHCQYTDKEIAKSFIEDVEAVKEQLPCGELMDFPETFEEFAKQYQIIDKQEVYTNGAELIPVFRVKQWLEHISTTKNDLGVDCISRQEVLRLLANSIGKTNTYLQTKVLKMSSVTPQEPRWIPVSERLPEINEEAYSKDVLLSLRRETKWDIDVCRAIHITTIGYYDVNAISSDGVYLDTEGWVLENERRLPLSDVIAWMPLPKALPKAYREVENE